MVIKKRRPLLVKLMKKSNDCGITEIVLGKFRFSIITHYGGWGFGIEFSGMHNKLDYAIDFVLFTHTFRFEYSPKPEEMYE
jgi:hypothetical protein